MRCESRLQPVSVFGCQTNKNRGNRGHTFGIIAPRALYFFLGSDRTTISTPDTLVVLFAYSFSMASASTSTQPPAQAGKSTHPVVAQGDWTKNLVQLAKTAELK